MLVVSFSLPKYGIILSISSVSLFEFTVTLLFTWWCLSSIWLFASATKCLISWLTSKWCVDVYISLVSEWLYYWYAIFSLMPKYVSFLYLPSQHTFVYKCLIIGVLDFTWIVGFCFLCPSVILYLPDARVA